MVIRLRYRLIISVVIGILLMHIVLILWINTANSRNVISENQDKAIVPIVLYHSIMGNGDRYSVTPAEFENDLKYFKESGYTSVTMSNLIEYVYNDGPLPEKPIVISMDDGFFNNYKYAYPLLKKYNTKAVLSVVGKYSDDFTRIKSDNLSYSHVTWDQVNEMSESGLIEIQNHTYYLHTSNKGRIGTRKKKSESVADYEKALRDDIGKLQEKITETTGFTPNTFTYPYGAVSKESVDILKCMGFKATLGTYGGVNVISKDPDSLFELKRNDRPHGMATSSFLKRAYKASGLEGLL